MSPKYEFFIFQTLFSHTRKRKCHGFVLLVRFELFLPELFVGLEKSSLLMSLLSYRFFSSHLHSAGLLQALAAPIHHFPESSCSEKSSKKY